jgi:dTDP-4-amino-4,6-dideoxygalactose transaminase
MNELQAAYGLLQLKTFKEQIAKRKIIADTYRELLKDVEGISFLKDIEGVKHNYAYFPIFVNEKEYGMKRDELYEKLKEHNIYGRRYFYPLISQFSPYKGLDSAKPKNLPVAEKNAKQVICLPIYPDLDIGDVKSIIKIISNV